MAHQLDLTETIRKFSRTYTEYLGLLNKTILNSPLSLIESRIIFELDLGESTTAKSLSERFHVDKGYLSRIISGLTKNGFILQRITLEDKRVKSLFLTDKGKMFLEQLNRSSNAQIEHLISQLNPYEKRRFISSLGQAQNILAKTNKREVLNGIKIRNDFEPGDIGFVIQSHGELYKEEFGYGHHFEQYVTEGIVEFLQLPKPNKSRVWICEHNAYKMGFLLLFDRGDETAQLRYFFIYPEFRGSGIGNKLMNLFMDYLKEMNFKHCFLLTTNDLGSAVHLYKKYGFRMVEETETFEFGKSLFIQKYTLEL